MCENVQRICMHLVCMNIYSLFPLRRQKKNLYVCRLCIPFRGWLKCLTFQNPGSILELQKLAKLSPWEGSRGPSVSQLFPRCPSRTGPRCQPSFTLSHALAAEPVEGTESARSGCSSLPHKTRKLDVRGTMSRICGLTVVLCEVHVLFGKLTLASYKRSWKGLLSWFPAPSGPPLLAAACRPQRCRVCEFASLSVYMWLSIYLSM